MHTDDGLVPEEVHPHATDSTQRIEESPSILHIAQLSPRRRVGVPVGEAIPSVCYVVPRAKGTGWDYFGFVTVLGRCSPLQFYCEIPC